MIDPARAKSLGAALLAPAAMVVAAIVGVTAGLGTALLVLAGAALVGAVLLFWSSLERLTGESPLTLDEAIGLGAPSLEEERKRSVVRALKDLEYERGVGKISEDDYAELSARYRAEAKALLRALDTELSPARKEAEERLAKRLLAAGLPPIAGAVKAGEPQVAVTAPADADAPAPAAASDPPAGVHEAAAEEGSGADGEAAPAPVSPPPTCSRCSTPNDPDASFCKRCGAALSPGGSP